MPPASRTTTSTSRRTATSTRTRRTRTPPSTPTGFTSPTPAISASLISSIRSSRRSDDGDEFSRVRALSRGVSEGRPGRPRRGREHLCGPREGIPAARLHDRRLRHRRRGRERERLRAIRREWRLGDPRRLQPRVHALLGDGPRESLHGQLRARRALALLPRGVRRRGRGRIQHRVQRRDGGGARMTTVSTDALYQLLRTRLITYVDPDGHALGDANALGVGVAPGYNTTRLYRVTAPETVSGLYGVLAIKSPQLRPDSDG